MQGEAAGDWGSDDCLAPILWQMEADISWGFSAFSEGRSLLFILSTPHPCRVDTVVIPSF